jgi:hypothetical protein
MDESDVFVFQVGGKKELDLKNPKWQNAKGQAMIHKGMMVEWNNIRNEKGALIEASIEESQQIRAASPERIVGMRTVLTSRLTEEGVEEVKCRMVAQGHKDPDVLDLVRRRLTAAPTVSGLGRWVTFWLISTLKFHLQLGDIRGAFLECDPMVRDAGPLFLSQPKGGIPGLSPGQILKVKNPL